MLPGPAHQTVGSRVALFGYIHLVEEYFIEMEDQHFLITLLLCKFYLANQSQLPIIFRSVFAKV